jgi:hypothetical protein
VLDLVPLARAGREVRDADRQAGPIREPLEFYLPAAGARDVAATCVGRDGADDDGEGREDDGDQDDGLVTEDGRDDLSVSAPLPYVPAPEYGAFKGQLYGQIDPRFQEFFPTPLRCSIRLDQVDWGGVVVNGIPPLDHPHTVSAANAGYLDDDNIIFGLYVDAWRGRIRRGFWRGTSSRLTGSGTAT